MLCIVDPYTTDRESTSKFFNRIGYSVAEFATGDGLLNSDGLQGDVTAVVAELDLPDMSGIELARELRERKPELAIIILTRSDDVVSAVQAHKSEVDAVISKPYVARQPATCLAALVATKH